MNETRLIAAKVGQKISGINLPTFTARTWERGFILGIKEEPLNKCVKFHFYA